MDKNLERHHYISQVYLKNFSPENRPGEIHVIEPPDKEYFFKSIEKDVAFEYNYNTMQLNGENTNKLEKLFGMVETKLGRVLKKIKNNNFKLSNEEISDLFLYMTFLNINNPNFRQIVERGSLQTFDAVTNIISSDKNILKNELEKANINYEGIDLDELISFMKDKSKYKILIPKEDLIVAGLQQIDTFFEIFNTFHWNFYIIKDDSMFLTSDFPVIPIVKDWNMPYMPGYGIADSIIFPLTKKVCFIGQRMKAPQLVYIPGEVTNKINSAIFYYSNKYVYSPMTYKEYENQLQKYNNPFKLDSIEIR